MSPRVERDKPRSLLPREHGAWGQLGVPLAAALASGSPSAAGALFAVAAWALFLAHEPLLVALGRRGPRALREDGARARRVGAALAAVASLAGTAALALAPSPARGLAAGALCLGALTGVFVARDAERSLAGETVAAAALAAAASPVAVCAGLDARGALWSWAAWALGFATVTASVRGVIAHARAPAPLARRLAALAPSLAATALAVAAAPRGLGVAVAPLSAVSLLLACAPPPPTKLRRVGWGLVAGSLATGAALVGVARAGGW